MLTFENQKKLLLVFQKIKLCLTLIKNVLFSLQKFVLFFSSKVLLPLNMSKNVFSQLRSLGVGTAKVQKCFLEGIPLLFVTFRSLSE